MALWLDWAKINKAPVTGGAWAPGYVNKLVVHTTESSGFHPGLTYFGHTGWPHWTNDRDGTLWQHMDADAPARALKNAPGGVETNRGGAWQVENVGFAAMGDAALTAEQVATLRRLVAELHRRRGLQMHTLPAGAIPGSAKVDAPQRLTLNQWRVFGGIAGHRHVPENDHWDPGAFNLERLLPAPTPPPAPPEEDTDMKPYLAQAEGTPVYLIFPNGQAEAGVPTQDALDDCRRIYGDTIEEVSLDFLRLHGIDA
jgi:hypothetical protein